MDTVLKISAVALVGALLALILKKQAPEHAMLVTVACGAVLLLFALDLFGTLAQYWDRHACDCP